jgi:hypothetical protein
MSNLTDALGTVSESSSVSDTRTEEQILQDQALLLELLGDEGAVLISRMEQHEATERIEAERKEKAAKQAAAKKEARQTAPKSTSGLEFFDAYQQWLQEELDFVESTLEAIYPGNVDVQVNNPFSQADKEDINASFRSANKDVTRMSGTGHAVVRSKKVADVIIKFPEVVISNSHRKSHTIKDLYIHIQLSGVLRFMDSFRGIRATKTYAEYCSRYGHSHMQSSDLPTHTSQFCLGSTDFSNLVSGLMQNNWNRLMFEMYAIQLIDYLKWESLEGGPYAKLEEIRTSSQRRRFQPPNSTTLSGYYTNYVKKYPASDINVEDNGHALKISVTKDTAFWDRVTAITDSSHRLAYNPTKGETYEESSDDSEFYNEISRINRDMISRSTGLKFKGVPIKVQLEVQGATNKKEEKEYKAHESVRDYIATTLETQLNEHFQNEFCC